MIPYVFVRECSVGGLTLICRRKTDGKEVVFTIAIRQMSLAVQKCPFSNRTVQLFKTKVSALDEEA